MRALRQSGFRKAAPSRRPGSPSSSACRLLGGLYGGGSPPLEKLHGPLVLLRGGPGLEGPEVSAPARLRIFLPGVEPVAAGRELADHSSASGPATSRSPSRPPSNRGSCPLPSARSVLRGTRRETFPPGR